jgi:hypothetical protein
MRFIDEILNPKLLKNTFSISAANPKINGNIKILIDDNLCYLESISANDELNESKLKGFVIDTKKALRSNIKNFCDLLEDKTAIYDAPEQDFEVVEKYISQPSTLYRFGAYSDTDKRVDATHRFFAPLFVGDDGLPDGFAIFKVTRGSNGELNVLTNENAQMVKYYDLTRATKFGTFLANHILEVEEQEVGISVNYTDDVSVVGMEINSGVITEKSIYINEDLLSERTITESESFLSKAYELSNLLDPRFLNLEFTFSLDTVDASNTDTYVEFIGMYVKNNEIIDSQLDPVNNINIALADGYVQTDAPIVLPSPLYTAVGTIKGASVGVSKPPMGIIKFNSIPNVNQVFSFDYAGGTEITLTITPDHQGSDIESTIELIADALTDEFLENAVNLVLRFQKFGTDELHVYSTIASPVLETVEISSVPLSCEVVPPFIGSYSGTLPNLFGTDVNTLTLAVQNITDAIDAVEFSDGTVAVPLLGFRYGGTYSYKMDINVEGKPLLDIKQLVERPIVYYRVQNIEHRKLDYNRDKSYHADPLDFNLDVYRNYLLDRISQPDFYGRLDPPPASTPQEIADYKAELITIVNTYFNNIDIPSTEMLVKSIDKADFSFETTNNEYEPLQEYNEVALLSASLYEWISKFSIRDGFDVTNSPQKFNTSMTFRYDSFTPSLNIATREVGEFTHSWFLIGSGTPPWYGTDVIDGYTLNSVSEASILDQGTDVYGTDIFEWSIIKTDPKSGVTSTFFRGVRVIFPDEFHGYKFSVVLISDTAPSNSDTEIKLLENKTFQTLTLKIAQYIPEPVLTGLEEAGVYYLDRSVLYYSSGGNTTEVSLASIGEEAISLLLFENTAAKTYNGLPVPTDWVYNDNGTPVAHVKLNPSVNNFDLRTMLGLGDDFTIFYGDISPSATLTFGIQIVFKNIVEIAADYFWCTGIEVTLKENGVTTFFDIVPVYFLDNTILFNDNRYATAESIARYDALFDRTISNDLSGDRYQLISTSNISNTINRTNTELLDDNGEERTVNISTAQIEEIPILQSFEYDFTTYDVSSESDLHRFKALRPSFFYDPITSVLIPSQQNRIDITHQDIVWFRKASVSLKLDGFTNQSRISDGIPLVENNIGDVNFDTYYSYHLNRKDFENVKWMYTPSEIRGYLSKCVSVVDDLSVDTTFTNERFSLIDVLYDYSRKILDRQDIINYIFEEADYTTALRIYDVNTDNITDEEIRDVITKAHITNVLINVLRVKSVTINGVEHDTSNVSETIVKILSLDGVLDGNCTVNFVHQ